MIENPLIMVDGNQLIIYETIEDAESDIEILDIDYGIKIFDSTGQKLIMKVVNKNITRKFLSIKYRTQILSVSIQEDTSSKSSENELRDILNDFVKKNKLDINTKTLSIRELVKEVGDHIPYRL